MMETTGFVNQLEEVSSETSIRKPALSKLPLAAGGLAILIAELLWVYALYVFVKAVL